MGQLSERAFLRCRVWGLRFREVEDPHELRAKVSLGGGIPGCIGGYGGTVKEYIRALVQGSHIQGGFEFKGELN